MSHQPGSLFQITPEDLQKLKAAGPIGTAGQVKGHPAVRPSQASPQHVKEVQQHEAGLTYQIDRTKVNLEALVQVVNRNSEAAAACLVVAKEAPTDMQIAAHRAIACYLDAMAIQQQVALDDCRAHLAALEAQHTELRQYKLANGIA